MPLGYCCSPTVAVAVDDDNLVRQVRSWAVMLVERLSERVGSPLRTATRAVILIGPAPGPRARWSRSDQLDRGVRTARPAVLRRSSDSRRARAQQVVGRSLVERQGSRGDDGRRPTRDRRSASAPAPARAPAGTSPRPLPAGSSGREDLTCSNTSRRSTSVLNLDAREAAVLVGRELDQERAGEVLGPEAAEHDLKRGVGFEVLPAVGRSEPSVQKSSQSRNAITSPVRGLDASVARGGRALVFLSHDSCLRAARQSLPCASVEPSSTTTSSCMGQSPSPDACHRVGQEALAVERRDDDGYLHPVHELQNRRRDLLQLGPRRRASTPARSGEHAELLEARAPDRPSGWKTVVGASACSTSMGRGSGLIDVSTLAGDPRQHHGPDREAVAQRALPGRGC